MKSNLELDKQLIAWQQGGSSIRTEPLGLSVFYREFGSSEALPENTLLLLHGFPESSFSYHKVIEGLLENYQRIIVFDFPGYGFSDKPGSEYSYSLVAQADSAFQVWQKLGVLGGHIISHDMGTSVLTEILARQDAALLPAWFSSGVLSATFTNGSMVLELAKLRVTQKLLLNPRLGPLVSRHAKYAVFRKTVLSAHGVEQTRQGGLSEEDVRLLWESCQLQDGHRKNHHIIRYLNDRRRYEKTRWLPALASISKKIPINICWGDADQVARIEMAHYLKDKVCVNSNLMVMPGVGHFGQIGSPQKWLKCVTEALMLGNSSS